MKQLRRNNISGLSADYVRDIFHYDAEIGCLYWKRRNDVRKEWNTRHAGKKAGFHIDRGYFGVVINNATYPFSHIAWLWMTGLTPVATVDHVDLNPSNNKWDNLRAATESQQQYNQRKPANNKSGYKGVCFVKRLNRWRAEITVKYKHYHLGLFDTAEEAHAAYCKAATELHGEFARAA